MTGMNGGGAFLLVYLLVCLIICIPLFTAEISLGRKTQLTPIEGMRKLTKKGGVWTLIGWFGVISALIIMSYYLMIMGWILAYLFKIVSGQFTGVSAEQIGAAFGNFIAQPVPVAAYTLAVIVMLGLIVTRGLKDGIEKSCKIMMPLLFVFLIALAIRSLTFPGALAGLKWYLTPDISKINANVVLAALGQAFYSIGVGMAAAYVYGSYLHPTESDVPGGAATIVAFDTLAAFIAGLVIFPALFAFGLEPNAGAGLLFVTMTNLFSQIPGGSLFGGAFFFLVMLAGLTSGIGLLEAVVASVIDSYNISRKKAVWGSLAIMFVLGIPTILSCGPWANVLLFGKNFFDLADYVSGNVLLTAGALLLAIYTAFVWKFENFRDETNIGAAGFKVANWWKPFVTYLIPVAVFLIMVRGLGIF